MLQYKHEPQGYDCPFCILVKGIEDPDNKRIQSKQQDIVYALIKEQDVWKMDIYHLVEAIKRQESK